MKQTGNTAVHRIKNYTFLKQDLLGQGSTGKVYMGFNDFRKQKVAIKMIAMAEINNQVTKYLLECEKQALTTISHPNVLHAYDIIQQQQFCYIVTQICPHGTLKEHIRSKKNLTQKQALQIFQKLINGYQAIKQKCFIHRDIKSANVMLRNGEPIIIDFGYCEKTYGTKPKVFYNVGSPSYMSPEAYYRTIYSQKSDIWALGIILYQMIEGHTIDYGKDINKYFKGLIKNGFYLKNSVSEGCLQLLKMSLEINQNKRADLQKLLIKLRQISNQHPQQNIPPVLFQQNKKISIKEYKAKTIYQRPHEQFMRNNAQLPQNHRLSIPQNNSIPLTQSIFKKPVSANMPHNIQPATNIVPQFTCNKPFPLTPTASYTQRPITQNKMKIQPKTLSNAHSVFSSASYQSDRIQLSNNSKQMNQRKIIHSFHEAQPVNIQNHNLNKQQHQQFARNRPKFLAQSLNIINQPRDPHNRGVNINIPNHQNRSPGIHHSVIIGKISHIHNQADQHLRNTQVRKFQQGSKQPIRSQSFRNIQPHQVDQQMNTKKIVYTQPTMHKNLNEQRNSHNQFISHAHQAFLKKQKPFFQEINTQNNIQKNIAIVNQRIQINPQIQNQNFNSNNFMPNQQPNMINPNQFNAPSGLIRRDQYFNQQGPAYTLNQQGNRNFIIQPTHLQTPNSNPNSNMRQGPFFN